jgi:PASTA domain
VFALACAAATACAAPALGKPPPPAPFTPPPTGTLAVCNTSGTTPVSGTFSYTLSTVASAGGTQVVNVPVGTCAPQIFYPKGSIVTVTENVPTGDAVSSITLAGGESTLSASTPASGSATVVIGLGQAVLTFTTTGPLPRCIVPNVVGLTLTTAAASLRKHSCRPGVVRRNYSTTVRAGRVISQSPRRGSNLAHNAAVALVLSRGRRP